MSHGHSTGRFTANVAVDPERVLVTFAGATLPDDYGTALPSAVALLGATGWVIEGGSEFRIQIPRPGAWQDYLRTLVRTLIMNLPAAKAEGVKIYWGDTPSYVEDVAPQSS